MLASTALFCLMFIQTGSAENEPIMTCEIFSQLLNNCEESQLPSVPPIIANLPCQCEDQGRFCTTGLADGRVQASSISASSSLSTSYEPQFARLNIPVTGWAPNAVADSWLEVHLHVPIRITGIITQGCFNTNYWVTRFKISYGDSTDNMEFVQQFNDDLVFNGNDDRSLPRANHFPEPITAEYIRFWPIFWSSRPCVRLEYMTCDSLRV
ncbi:lactadherin-like [Clavelina lepadiformis]|uniref:F5/8 type C domain-containing protein n=1 Tax=Clavelina lepadiformis TaxID=159417 RepID=A0ABP0FNH7_CLALP